MTELYGSVRPWSYLTAVMTVVLLLLVTYGYYRHKRIKGLIEDLKSGQPVIAQSAATSLGEMGSDIVDYLLPMIKDMDSQSRAYAAEALRKNDSAVRSLVAGLTDEDIAMRAASVEVLGKMGDAAKDSVPVLIKFLEDDDERLRKAAMMALGDIKDTQAIEPLFGSVYREGSQDRTAHVALAKMGSAVMPFLLAKLGDEEARVRQSAASVLAEVGAEAKGSSAVPLLIALLKNQPNEVQREAVRALGKIGDERAVSPLMALLNKTPIPLGVVEALGDIGPPAKAAEAFLFEMMWIDSPQKYAAALRRISPEYLDRINYDEQRSAYLEYAISFDELSVTKEESLSDTSVPFTFQWLLKQKANVVFCAVVLIDKGVDPFDGNYGIKINAEHNTNVTRNLSYRHYSSSRFKWGVEVKACKSEEQIPCDRKTGLCAGRTFRSPEQTYIPE